jgi:hypothetical protein
MVTEPLENDRIPDGINIGIIEYNSLSNNITFLRGGESESADKIEKSFRSYNVHTR